MWVHQDWVSGHWELGLERDKALSAEVGWDREHLVDVLQT